MGRALLRYTDRDVRRCSRGRCRATRWPRGLRRDRDPARDAAGAAVERLRAFAFRFVSELGIAYRRSAAAVEGTPHLDAGPRAGRAAARCAGVARRARDDAAARAGSDPACTCCSAAASPTGASARDALRRLHDRYGDALKISAARAIDRGRVPARSDRRGARAARRARERTLRRAARRLHRLPLRRHRPRWRGALARALAAGSAARTSRAVWVKSVTVGAYGAGRRRDAGPTEATVHHSPSTVRAVRSTRVAFV